MGFDMEREARLIDSLYQPCRSTLGECLARWRALRPESRERCYLVVDGDKPASRHTLSGEQIADLSARFA